MRARRKKRARLGFSSNPWVPSANSGAVPGLHAILFLTFNFQIIIGLKEVAKKKNVESHVPFS